MEADDDENLPADFIEARLAALQARSARLSGEAEVAQADAVAAGAAATELKEAANAAVEEMMAEAMSQEQTVVEQDEADSADDASSEALMAALDALEDDIMAGPATTGASAPNYDGVTQDEYGSELRSQALRDIEGLAREARSFVQGARAQLERLQDNLVERIAVEASVAVKIGEFILRRALLDTGRALAAASSSVLALGAAAPSSPPDGASTDGDSEDPAGDEGSTSEATEAREQAMPFAARLEKIERKRSESQAAALAASAEEGGMLMQAADAEAEAAAAERAGQWAAQAEAQREGVEEAAEETAGLLKDALAVATDAASKGAEKLLTEMGELASDGTAGKDALARTANALATRRAASMEEVPDADAMRQRAATVGERLQSAAAAALEMSRADFESFSALKDRGQLPTLLEEAESSLGLPALPEMSELPSLLSAPGVGASGGKGAGEPSRGVLGAFQSGDDEFAQRERLRRLGEMETATKQLRLAAALGGRAAKDSGDALVYGVLPAATAVGKVAARRLGERLPGLVEGKDAAGSGGGLVKGGSAEGTAGLVMDIAQQMAAEYAATSKLQDAVAGITKKIEKAAAMGETASPIQQARAAPLLRSTLDSAADVAVPQKWVAAVEAAVEKATVAVEGVSKATAADGDATTAEPDARSISEDEAKAAWLSQRETPTWGGAGLADEQTTPTIEATSAPQRVSEEDEARAEWLSKLEAPTWGAAAATDAADDAVIIADASAASPFIEEVAVGEYVSEDDARRAVFQEADGLMEDEMTNVYVAEAIPYKDADEDGAVRPGAAEPAADSDVGFDAEVSIDVDVTEMENVDDREEWLKTLVAAIDLTALAVEIAVDTVSESPARDMAEAWLASQETAKEATMGEEWRVLGSLSAERRKKRRRMDAARRELLEEFTKFVERE